MVSEEKGVGVIRLNSRRNPVRNTPFRLLLYSLPSPGSSQFFDLVLTRFVRFTVQIHESESLVFLLASCHLLAGPLYR